MQLKGRWKVKKERSFGLDFITASLPLQQLQNLKESLTEIFSLATNPTGTV